MKNLNRFQLGLKIRLLAFIFEEIVQYVRTLVSIFAWIWAVIIFIIGYYGNLSGIELEAHDNRHNVAFRSVFIPIIKILLVAPSVTYATQNPTPPPPPHTQYMAMNQDDGQYSFGYTSVDSSRTERRHPDGRVEGKYSYLNPDGKLVEVQYEADALRGFKTTGPQVPIDTPAVREAREKFLATYERELQRIRSESPNKSTEENPEDSEVVLATASAEKNEKVQLLTSESIGQNNVEVPKAQNNAQVAPLAPSPPSPSYFYYVGVGGMPYFVTAPVPSRESTDIAVSVRASQSQIHPASAVHDAQVPRYYSSKNVVRTSSSSQFSPQHQFQYNNDFAQAPNSQFQHQGHYETNLNFNQNYNQNKQYSPYSHSPIFPIPYFTYPFYVYK